MRADVRNHPQCSRRSAALVCLLAAVIGLGVAPAAVAQPAATDQYVEEQPGGPGTELGTAPAPPPADPQPVAEPAPVEAAPAAVPAQPQPSATEQQPEEAYTPSVPVRPTTLTAEPAATDDGESGTLWLGGYGVTPFVFCIAAIVAACLLWRLGSGGLARLRAG